MLKTWTIGNFRSIREPITLDFAPLTIFAGANSSGKSTMIQSLLMLAQSLSPESEGYQVVLNGKYTKLGNIRDILHWGNENEPLRIGFELESNDEFALPITMQSLIGYHPPLRSVARTSDKSIPWVQETTVQFYDHEQLEAHGVKKRLTLCVKALKGADLGRLRDYVTLSPETRERIKYGTYDYTMGQPMPQDLVRDITLERVKRAGVPNLLPTRMLVECNLQLSQLYDDVQWIIDTLARLSRRDPPASSEIQPGYLSMLIRDVFRPMQIPPPEPSPFDRKNKQDMRPFNEWVVQEAGLISQQSLLDRIQSEEYAPRALADFSRYLEVALARYKRQRPPFDASSEMGALEVRLLPQNISWALDQIKQVFGQNVYYLGPLRADPSVVYAAPANTAGVNVGLKGEYTAAMLDEYRKMEIEFPYPIPVDEKIDGTYRLGRKPLIDAIVYPFRWKLGGGLRVVEASYLL